jgi:hypothetical protein
MTSTIHPLALLREQADAFINAGFSKLGAPAGVNGPHGDPETTYRNTAHWLALLSRLWILTRAENYRTSANDLANFLIHDDALTNGTLPVMRMKKGKDLANGVIGAGWLIEGLVVGGKNLGRDELNDVASRLAHYVPLDPHRALWRTREPDGTVREIDTTLNHQIWFGMACAMLPAPDGELRANIRSFVEGLHHHLRHVDGGLLVHTVRSPILSKANFVEVASRLLPNHRRFSSPVLDNQITRKLLEIKKLHTEKETGYLAFTLHALARLISSDYGSGLDRNVCSRSYRKLLTLCHDAEFDQNQWSFPYNPPGFEFPVIAEVLGNSEDVRTVGHWLYRRQLEKTYDADTRQFTKGNPDPATLTARLYSLSLCSPTTLDLLAG